MEEKKLTESESLHLITMMINKAKNSYHDTGISAMMWGIVVAVCSLVKFAEIQFNFRLPFDIYWLTVAAIIPQVLISRREKKVRTAVSYDDNYMDYIWLGFGISIALMILIVNVMGNQWQPVAEEYRNLAGKTSSFQLFEFISPLFLLLYGMPTFITGAACRFYPMLWGGIFCWICCGITCFTDGRVDLLLVAASAIFAWFIPGVLMEKDYRKYKKEQAARNV